MRFLVDENLPFSVTKFLRESNYEVIDVAESGLRGSTDILELFKKFLNTIKIDELKNNIVVITPGKIRFRRLNKEGSE